MEKTCPKCNTSGEIETLFGWRMCDGVKRSQSQCKSCRSGKAKTSMPAARDHKKPPKQTVTERELHDELHPEDKGKPAKQIRMEAAAELAAEYGLTPKKTKAAKKPEQKQEPVDMRKAVLNLADALVEVATVKDQVFEAWRSRKPVSLVLELGARWTVCDGCIGYSGSDGRIRMTLDPAAAGWIPQPDGSWDCIECRIESLEHGWVEFEKKCVNIRLGHGDDAWRKAYTMKELDALIAQTKDAKILKIFKDWKKYLTEAQTSSSYSRGHSARDGETALIKKLLNFQAPAAPIAPIEV